MGKNRDQRIKNLEASLATQTLAAKLRAAAETKGIPTQTIDRLHEAANTMTEISRVITDPELRINKN